MDLQQLIEFDQKLLLKLNMNDSVFWDHFMMAVTETITWIPLVVVLLYVLIKNTSWRDMLLIVVMTALCVIVADQFASSFCKPYFERFRPTNDPLLMYQVDVVDNYRCGRYGFISSHAANHFSIFAFNSLLIRKRALTFTLLLNAMLCSYSRIYLGVHYPGDVLAGTLWGLLTGTIIYWIYRRLHRRVCEQRSFISSQYTSTGYLVTDVQLLLSVSYLTLFFAAVYSCYL